MAKAPVITGALTRAPSNILPFRRPAEPLAYAPGVNPFDRSNPVHVAAWNTLHEIGWREQARERN